MLKPLTFFSLFICAPGIANAACVLAEGSVNTLNISEQTFTIDADLAQSTSSSFARANTPLQGSTIKYDNCVTGELSGRDSSLKNQDATRIFPTNIPGVGIKITWYPVSGAPNTKFPYSNPLNFDASKPPGVGSMVIGPTSSFGIELFKTAPTIGPLTDKSGSGDIILPAQELAWIWLTTPTQQVQRFTIGTLRLISTPSCSYDTTKTVSFGTVSSRTLTSQGIEKPLDFTITCKTDYGYYAANASISTQTPSTDSSYIKVTDAAGDKETLGIKIRDSKGTIMAVDGSTSEEISGLASLAPATFSWKAVLFPVSVAHPTNGDFTAQAEILLQIK